LKGAEFDLRLQARHPDLEKFVQVVADDAQEAQPLQQRHVGIFGLRQHSSVELELRQFPIQVKLRIGALGLARLVGDHRGALLRRLFRRERGRAVGGLGLDLRTLANSRLPGDWLRTGKGCTAPAGAVRSC